MFVSVFTYKPLINLASSLLVNTHQICWRIRRCFNWKICLSPIILYSGFIIYYIDKSTIIFISKSTIKLIGDSAIIYICKHQPYNYKQQVGRTMALQYKSSTPRKKGRNLVSSSWMLIDIQMMTRHIYLKILDLRMMDRNLILVHLPIVLWILPKKWRKSMCIKCNLEIRAN